MQAGRLYSLVSIVGLAIAIAAVILVGTLTRTGAEKYFPGDAALGQTLTLEDRLPMTVTAVIDDMPASTHFPFHFLVPLDVAHS